MEIIDRYLQAVRFWLPEKQKEDIIAELSEDLHSQIEDQETGLGRKLNEAELAVILKQRGRPVLVANRFQPQQQLIGPVLFPIYLFVLKLVGVFYVLPWVLVWTGITVSRAAHTGTSLIQALASFWTTFWPMAFFMVASVTIVFAILERVQSKSGFLEKWDPGKLPPVRDPNRIPLSNSLTEVAANLVFSVWLIGGMWYQTVLHFSGVTITLAPVWSYFFWGYMALAVANTAASAANLFSPYWTLGRATTRLATDSIGAVLFCWMLKANILVGITVANIAPEKTNHLVAAINWWIEKMFPFAIVACAVIVAVSAYRVLRVRAKSRSGVVFNAPCGIPR